MGRGQLAVGSGQLAGKKDRALTGVRGDRKSGVKGAIRLIGSVFLPQSDKKKIGK